MANNECVAVFLKYPQRGKVKTRLAKGIGSTSATSLYAAMVEKIVHEAKNSGRVVAVFCSPANALPAIRQWLGTGCLYFTQKGRGLGARMRNAFTELFEAGYENVVLSGSDIPALDKTIFVKAFKALQGTGAALGPSVDGGYYLIGSAKRSFNGDIFKGIPWSGPDVFFQTVAAARKNNIIFTLLPRLRDIDDADGLEAGMIESFQQRLKKAGHFPLKADSVGVLQLNVGRKCNLSCAHCHVEAGPHRTEVMGRETFADCLNVIKNAPGIHTVDITGGAPELNPSLEWFLGEVSKLSRRLIVRTNLAILTEKPYKKFIGIYAANKIEVCGSLPCYLSENADSQRGKGNFAKCVEALQALNTLGYGKEGSGLILDLVHNPVEAALPGPQKDLEEAYKKHLKAGYNIEFNTLFCLTNIPVGRYRKTLREEGRLETYMQALANAYNPATIQSVMCRNTVSVGWDGRLYDCDFNQMLEMPAGTSIKDFDGTRLKDRTIQTGSHCYGCTAGSGSSCQGTVI